MLISLTALSGAAGVGYGWGFARGQATTKAVDLPDLSAVEEASLPVTTVEFEGVVEAQSLTLPAELWEHIRPGDPVRGRFSYSPAMGDSNPSPHFGRYVHYSPRFLLEVRLGSASISTDPESPHLIIQVLDDARIGIAPDGIDRFDVISVRQTALRPSKLAPGQLHLLMADWTRQVFASDALPAEPPPLERFATEPRPRAGQVATTTGQAPQIFVNFRVDAWRAYRGEPD